MTDLLYICVICAAPLNREHQVCCEACYRQLVRQWMESLQ
jgi:predicted nucleic acid-binding Zn ribbon protein